MKKIEFLPSAFGGNVLLSAKDFGLLNKFLNTKKKQRTLEVFNSIFCPDAPIEFYEYNICLKEIMPKSIKELIFNLLAYKFNYLERNFLFNPDNVYTLRVSSEVTKRHYVEIFFEKRNRALSPVQKLRQKYNKQVIEAVEVIPYSW